jgi:Family of unknown function (DUF6152)
MNCRYSRTTAISIGKSMRIRRAVTRIIGIGAGVLLAVSLAFAHHSAVMFEPVKQVTLVGSLKELQWSNPHCWIQLLVPDANNPDAAPTEWSIEMDSPLALFRRGWKPGSLNAGHKITVVVSPLRDGRAGGRIVSVIGPDGKAIGRAAVAGNQ